MTAVEAPDSCCGCGDAKALAAKDIASFSEGK